MMGMNEQPMVISQISCPGGTVYTIVAGDTLFNLARRFNTTVQAIQNANRTRPQCTESDE